jgi:isocitrate/isopropylmalate dehydrogenase
VAGEILTPHVRSIDSLARAVRYAGAVVPEATLAEVRAKLAVLCGMTETPKRLTQKLRHASRLRLRPH